MAPPPAPVGAAPVDLSFSAEDEDFREEVATWLAEHLVGDFAPIRGRGGPGDEDVFFDARDSKYSGAGAGSQHASDEEPEGEAGDAGVSSPERSGA